MKPVEATVDQAAAWLRPGVKVKGEIIGTQDLLIEGSVEGMIQLEAQKLTVGPTAQITADIHARDVVVYGHVKGNVRAAGRIEIKKNGSVIGNLTTAQIMIEDGADFKGSIEIERSQAKEIEKDPSLRAASVSAGAEPRSIPFKSEKP